jgi:hypothetical protein
MKSEPLCKNPAGDALAYVLEGSPPQATRITNAVVKPTTLDLTIGKIFIPDTPANEVGGSNNGKNEHSLAQGHTAVIRAREILRMGPGAFSDCISPVDCVLKRPADDESRSYRPGI